MAEPSAQNMNEQAQQNAWAQTASQQQPLHPMVAGGSYVPPPTLPIQSTNAQGSPKPKETTISMGRLSLLGVAFSLMLLGALTFLGGFLLGMWFAGPTTPSIAMPALGYLPSQQYQAFPQNTAIPPQGGQAIQNLTGRAGDFTQATITNPTIPNVPSFLAPLVMSTQSTAGQQLGSMVQQQVNQRTRRASPSAPQPQPSSPPEYQRSMPYPLHTTSTLPLEQPSPPVITPQQNMPSSSPASEETTPLSQGEHEDYTIQLGIFASKENAFSLVNDLQGMGFNAHITDSKTPDGAHLYYVHSGRYKDYTTALEAASQFASQNIPGAIIVKVSQKNKSAS